MDLLAVAAIREEGALSLAALEQVLGVSGDAVDGNGQPLLHHAVIAGRPDMVSLLIARGADVNQPAPDGTVALHHVRGDEGAEVTGLLLKAGAAPDQRNNAGQTPLMWLAFRGEIDPAVRLLDSGANVDLVDRNGRDAVVAALRGRQTQAVALLLKRLPSATPDAWREYLQAAIRYQAEVTAVGQGPFDVLAQYARSAFTEDEWSKECWVLAVRTASRGYTAALSALVPFIRNLNARDGWGKTLAHYAASSGEMKALGVLVRGGADLSVRDREGRTVADYCTSQERRQKVQQWAVDQKGRSVPITGKRSPHP